MVSKICRNAIIDISDATILIIKIDYFSKNYLFIKMIQTSKLVKRSKANIHFDIYEEIYYWKGF